MHGAHGRPAAARGARRHRPLRGAATAPTAVVVFSHGFGNTPEAWRAPIRRAAEHGALAIAMSSDAERTSDPAASAGWHVRENAAAGIAAAQAAKAACPGIVTGVNFGVSMGGNTSGLIAADPAARGLFQWWIDVEGATNPLESYLEARAVGASGNGYAVSAYRGIEEAVGGPLEQTGPAPYLALSPVAHAEEMAANGLRGAILVHALDDGLVPFNQSREMRHRLDGAGVPAQLFTVGRAGDADTGTTADSYVPVAHPKPLAGHGWEGSQTHTVIQTALGRLDALLAGEEPSCAREFLVDGAAGSDTAHPLIAPDPAAVPC